MRSRTIRRQVARTNKETAHGQLNTNHRAPIVGFSLLLVVGTLFLYSGVRDYDFINYDDDGYVTQNPHVATGLSLQTVRWSLTSTEQCNWHPLTWLSHALDYQLFGLDAGYHHLSSVVIHVFNVLLLFLLFQCATGDVARSFLVAALFAWHPFNVESVAWVAERKNVLSTFFFLLTLGTYGWYARQPRLKSFALVAGDFVLALASKPMAVSLPFVLLLLDYWPLQRIAGWTKPHPLWLVPQQPISRLLLEKLPLLALSAVSCAITVRVQEACGAVRTLTTYPLGVRLENALHSYVMYLWKTLWPSSFALLYPHPHALLPAWKLILSAALLGAISVVAWRQRTARPYLIVGWLWFLGTLVPVIGVVQVGIQAMADRYAYLPTIGLFVIVVWGVFEFFDLLRVPAMARWATASVVLLTLWLLTLQQLRYWQDSLTIWSHTLQVTTGNPFAEKRMAWSLAARGDTEEATLHFVNTVELDPTDVGAYVTLGSIYASQGRLQDGIRELETAVKLTDSKMLSAEDRRFRCSALIDLGFAHILSNDYANALVSFQGANQSDPVDVARTIENIKHSIAATPSEASYLDLSLLLRALGRNKEAATILEDAIKANPGYGQAEGLLSFLNAS